MITPITRNNIELLELCTPGLQRELDRSTLKELWDIPALYDHVVNFSVFAFYQHESAFAGVISIQEAPKMKILNCFWVGKDKTNKVPIDHAEVDSFLTHMGKELGCGRIICDGRPGWAKIGTPLGYSDTCRVYAKSLGG